MGLRIFCLGVLLVSGIACSNSRLSQVSDIRDDDGRETNVPLDQPQQDQPIRNASHPLLRYVEFFSEFSSSLEEFANSGQKFDFDYVSQWLRLPARGRCSGAFLAPTTDGEVSKVIPECSYQPTPDWVCRAHPKDSRAGTVNLIGFNPRNPQGYTLHLRPGAGHCANLALSLELEAVGSGQRLALDCSTDLENGPCEGSDVRVNIRSQNNWFLKASVLERFANNASDRFILRYDWSSSPGGNGATCAGSIGSYGVAFYVTRGATPAPPNAHCINHMQ